MVDIGEGQRWHRELVLGSHMQHFPARHQDLELWAGGEQSCHLLCRAHNLLEVVQQQQHLSLSQFLCETFQEYLATSFPDDKRLSNGRHDQGRITDRSQVHEKHATGKQLTDVCCHLQAEAGFSCPSWTRECHEAHVFATQQVCDGRHLLLATKKRRRLDRQVVGRAIEGVERWKVGGQVGDHELEEAHGTSQVLEAMLAEIAQMYALRQVLFHEGADRLGE